MIIIATFFMGIGYATVNSVILNVQGNINAKIQNDIYIMAIEKENSINNENYEIKYADKNIMKSKVYLENNSNSEISLRVTIKNISNYDYIFRGITYDSSLIEDDESIYSNDKITYTYTNKDNVIKKDESLDVIVTFKYTGNDYSNNILESMLNFELKKIYKVTYNAFADTTGLPTTVIEGETLVVDVSKLNYYYFTIYGQDKLILDEDYTFINRVITIKNVQSDIVITTFGAVTNGLITLSNQHINTENNYGDYSIINENTELYGTACTYQSCYSDNGGKFEYNFEGALVLDEDNTIGTLNIDSSMEINDEFSLYATIKTDINNAEEVGTLIAVSPDNRKYLLWVGFVNGYMHVYSYRNGTAKLSTVEKYKEESFLCTNVSKYSNKIVNIQVTAVRGGITKVYINGSLIEKFDSGKEPVEFINTTIGDLRPGRKLKFKGLVYDIALYKRALTEEEIQTNWNYANGIWKIV